MVEVELLPDPLTDESARESDQRAWVRAVEVEARQLARDRTFALRAVALAREARDRAAVHAERAAHAHEGAGVWSAPTARVDAWDGAADDWNATLAAAARLASSLNRRRVDLFASSLLWSDELAALRRATATEADRAARVERKRQGARLRALRAIARDCKAFTVAAYLAAKARGEADGEGSEPCAAALRWADAIDARDAEAGGES